MNWQRHRVYRVYWVDISHDNDWIEFDDIDRNIETDCKPMVASWTYIKSKKIFGVRWLYFTSSIDKSGRKYFERVMLPEGVIVKAEILK
jgi:hypothetical protein